MNIVLSVFVFLGAAMTAAEEAKYPRAELLVSPEQLADKNFAASFVVLDARPKAKFDAGHVPNARWVDPADWAKSFDGNDAKGWGQRIAGQGIGAKSKVVVYDDAMNKDAARVWWILRYWGVEDVRLLNGGWSAWTRKNLPVSKTPPETIEAAEFHPQPFAARLATKEKILETLPQKSFQIVDARSEGEYCGTEKLKNQRAGAIPGAKHLEWSDLINAETQEFKPAAELKKLFAEAGIDLDRPTITHCQGGGRSSVMAFGLELMGAKDVRNFYRGWSEWGNTPDTPIEPGKAK